MPPLYHMDQIGSLLRPQSLLQARAELSSPSNLYSTPSSGEIKSAERQAIRDVIAHQLSLGLRPIVSGEFCRHIFYSGFFETLEGMEVVEDLPIPEAFRSEFPTTQGLRAMGQKTRAAVVCRGEIKWKDSAYGEEWGIMKSAVESAGGSVGDLKITLPAPSYQHIQLRPGTAFSPSSGYKTDREYFLALGRAYTAEITSLYEAGCRNIQIDDPHLTYFCSSQFLSGCEKDGVDVEELLDLYLEAHNFFLKEIPGRGKDAGEGGKLHMGMHLCRGNMSGSKHWVSGSYDKIAEKLFSKTEYDTYYLEFDDVERSGGFEPLKYLPKGKNVVLGLVSTKKAELEDREVVKGRILEAAEVVAKGQGVSREVALGSLGLSPQCGFSSSSLAGGKEMTEERMWEKLVLVRDVAREIWGEGH